MQLDWSTLDIKTGVMKSVSAWKELDDSTKNKYVEAAALEQAR